MPTRQKRPSLTRRLSVTAALVGLQIYLGYSALGGQYGIESQRLMKVRIGELETQQDTLDAEIATFRKRISLLDPNKLDPDLLTERARALLGMTDARDILVPLPD